MGLRNLIENIFCKHEPIYIKTERNFTIDKHFRFVNHYRCSRCGKIIIKTRN